MPRLYDIAWQKPPPLVERYLRVVVDERMDHRGEVVRPLDPTDAERAVRLLLGQGVQAIAVCLLHAYANPAHEQMIKAAVERLAPGLPLAISSEVLPEIKEYERTSSTVVNAYVMPVVGRYLRRLQQGLGALGVRAPLLLMQSNGGLMSAEAAAAEPMHIIESGPAGGVVGAQALARVCGLENVITFDMGGTTAKAAMIERGEYARTLEYQIGGGIMTGSRLLTGAGYLLKVPAIDLAEVGAGGGSIVRIDAGGSFLVGPESAGAVPAPLCYGAGGTEPTPT
jgi:N-methylhydantoinase A